MCVVLLMDVPSEVIHLFAQSSPKLVIETLLFCIATALGISAINYGILLIKMHGV